MNKKIIFTIALIAFILILCILSFKLNLKNLPYNENNISKELNTNQKDNENDGTNRKEEDYIENKNSEEPKSTEDEDKAQLEQNSVYSNQEIEKTQNNIDNTRNKTIKTEIAPTGFMGSSLYKVILYSDGDVYVETFDGNGYEDENILTKELIAERAEYIEQARDEENYGMIIVKAKKIINRDIAWIAFE